MKKVSIYLAAVLVVLGTGLAARAATYVLHEGQNDPVDEGFGFYAVGNATALGVNDGRDAWQIITVKMGDDKRAEMMYFGNLSEAGIADMDANGWYASMCVNVIKTNVFQPLQSHHLDLKYRPASASTTLLFGLSVWEDENGDPIYNDYNNGNVTVVGAGSGYHYWTFHVAPGGSTADLYMDGQLLGTGLGPRLTGSWAAGLTFGDVSLTTDGVANYHLVDMGTSPALEIFPGDADCDGTVDADDAAILAANWLKMGDATWWDGDFNNDKNVDDIDATLMAANWGMTAASVLAVPEPGLIALVLSGLFGIIYLASTPLGLQAERREVNDY